MGIWNKGKDLDGNGKWIYGVFLICLMGEGIVFRFWLLCFLNLYFKNILSIYYKWICLWILLLFFFKLLYLLLLFKLIVFYFRYVIIKCCFFLIFKFVIWLRIKVFRSFKFWGLLLSFKVVVIRYGICFEFICWIFKYGCWLFSIKFLIIIKFRLIFIKVYLIFYWRLLW